MSNYTEYQKFLAKPESARLAGDVSLIYVPTTTKFDQPGSVISHLSKQAQILKTKRQDVTNAIEGTDAICLDVETTIEFTNGGGAYLPSLDHVLVDHPVTFPTIHIVHFDSERQIKQIRIHWDQASLLREVKVIGISGRAWPIRNVVDQMNILKNAATARDTAAVVAEENKLPPRPSSPQKHYIKDPYAAGSLTELISPSKKTAEPKFAGKRYTQDPYGAGSLEEILSPSKKAPAPVAPYAPSSHRRAARNPSDIFLKDDDDLPTPATPTKSKRSAPQAPKEYDSRPESLTEDQPIKAVSDQFKNVEIGSDKPETELKDDSKNPNSNPPARGEQARPFDFGGDEKKDEGRIISSYGGRGKGIYVNHLFHESDTPEKPVAKHAKAVQMMESQWDNNDEKKEEGRIISSYGGRGKGIYVNHLFHDSDTPPKPTAKHEKAVQMMESQWDNNDEKKEEGRIISSYGGRGKGIYANHLFHESDTPEKEKPTAKHEKAVQMMESHWDNYDERTQTPPHVPATSQRNRRNHNQPSWGFGDA